MAELFALGRSLGELLKSRNETVSVAESSTGGLISAALLAVPGASAYFVGGGVIYTRRARAGLLSMPEGDAMRGSTEEYALCVARLMRQRLDTTWALSESGAAGPTGNRYGDLAGHSCIAVVGPVERAITVETRQSDREANMWAFTRAALDLLKATLEEGVRGPVPGVR
jgi:nicotinamide-nucleotide amidase